MDDDKERMEEPAGAQRRRPPSTIELSATEVAAEPGPAEAAEPQAAPATEAASAPEGEREQPSEAGGEQASEPVPPQPGPVQHRSWPSLIGAGLAGGLVVLLAAGGAWLTLRPERDDANAALAARLAALELQLREVARRAPDPTAADLTARLAKLESALAAARPTPDPVLADRIAGAEVALKSIADRVAALARRTDDLASAQSATTESRPTGAEQADIERLTARVAAAESAAKTIQDQLAKMARAPTADRAARLAVAAAALKGAVERGAPYAAEFAAAKPLVADAKTLAPLEPFAQSGLPRQAAFARELSALAPEMLRHANGATRDGGYLDRLQAHAERLVRIRPVNDMPGDDAATVVARMEIKVAQDDLAGAVAEAAKLPEPVRAPAEPWIAKARARQAALAAAQRLAGDAFAALAASGS
jgi:hypothetical protein